jgi:hypothetical protein
MKAVPIFITSLADKRSRFLAEAEHHERAAAKARDAVAKIDATLALFEEGKWVRSKRRAYRADTEWFKWRELPRLIIDMLRDSPDPLSTGDLQDRIAALKGIVISTPAERRHYSRRVTGALNDKRRQGVIVADRQIAGRYLWRLKRDDE